MKKIAIGILMFMVASGLSPQDGGPVGGPDKWMWQEPSSIIEGWKDSCPLPVECESMDRIVRTAEILAGEKEVSKERKLEMYQCLLSLWKRNLP